MTQIGCSEGFYTTLVRKDWKTCEMAKIGNSDGGKRWEKCEKVLIGHSKSLQIN